MPIPITHNHDGEHNVWNNREENENKFKVDYSFLLNQINQTSKKVITASNYDADLLYKLWTKSNRSKSNFTVTNFSNVVSDKEIERLKSMGFIDKKANEIVFTKRGQRIITTISLAEPNNFEVNRRKKQYNEILSEMSKKGKPGYRTPKFASNNNNRIRL